jgi:hypothetical protein
LVNMCGGGKPGYVLALEPGTPLAL